MLALALLARASAALSADRPNILWITCEDMSPDLGCYGDAYARTPNLDRLAAEGMRFARAFTVAGVCAPSRSAIITGMYPSSIGTHHMRSKGVPPPYVKCFTEYLRAAGYYCTNNSKTDYNFDPPPTAWDESSAKAHWRNRPEGAPFFAVFNLTVTHESQIRTDEKRFRKNTERLRPEDRHDPAKAKLPSYYPDAPEFRADWARYHDLVTAMDLQVGDILRELEADGLAENTVVFFYSDHGRGLARAKRWIYDSGIHVPLIVRWPGKFGGGSVRDDVVSSIDLAPTMLAIAGADIPKHLQGIVIPGFAPIHSTGREFIHAARDRMDETYDIIRCVRGSRYKLIRNFEPEKPYAQPIEYMDEMPSMKAWRRLAAEGKLSGAPALFFRPTKPKEEFYDLEADPEEIVNLLDDSGRLIAPGPPGLPDLLADHRAELDRWMKEIGDLALVPEPELIERFRPGGKTPQTAAVQIDPASGPLGPAATVTLSCPTDGASIAYTADPGPKPRWLLYSSPIRAAALESGLIRAKACRIGWADGPVSEARYNP